MHVQKINNILLLNNEDRYCYSISEFVKLDKAWAVSTPAGWVTFVDEDEIFPIWPHKAVAEISVFEELKIEKYSIESIMLDDFIDCCMPDMKACNVLFGVFYNKNKEAIAVDADKLALDLAEERTI